MISFKNFYFAKINNIFPNLFSSIIRISLIYIIYTIWVFFFQVIRLKLIDKLLIIILFISLNGIPPILELKKKFLILIIFFFFNNIVLILTSDLFYLIDIFQYDEIISLIKLTYLVSIVLFNTIVFFLKKKNY